MNVHTPEKNSIFVRQKAYFTIMHFLNSAIGEGKYPDLLLGGLFKSEELSSAEKAIIVEIGYGILRHMGRIDYIIEHASRAAISRVGLNILNILRLCTYQAVFMDASPAGIINNAVALSSHEKETGGFVKRTVEGILRNKDVIYPARGRAPVEYISVYHSHPRWIVEKWVREFKDVQAVETLCSANNLKPPLTIRTNPLKTEREPLQRLLLDEGYSSSPTAFSPYGLVVDKKEDIFKTEAFKNGLFEVQDEGSQLITMLTGKPGGYVIDACTGNGGKSLFLSGLMKARGTVLAMDTHAGKLANLRRRAGRSGASNIRTMTPESANLKQLKGTADCVFIDTPCSGMGVFRRNPDSKWRLTEQDISELAAKQKGILREYSELVKPGGRLVYATCTISREENEEVVRAFLEENGCRKYADATGDYLNSILPARFLMLGVDHSQTGGVVRKLAEYYGPDQITVIVLDAHSDMFDFDLLYQAQIRLMELEMPFYLPSLPETTGYNNTFYGCGNFLKNLMDENAILPQNLFLIGVTDYPAGLPENEDDPAIKRYIESYMDRVQQGVRVFSKREVESSQDQMASALKSITTPYVYISVDMDVGAFAASSAVRFPNTFGMSEDLIYRTVAAIRQAIDSSNNCCVGLDIMEIDVHFAGYPSRGVDDRAYIIASNIINILWP